MDVLRRAFDKFYTSISRFVFAATEKDPEYASELFKSFLRTLDRAWLDKLVLDNVANHYEPLVPISNAAGFNKNGDISPETLKYLGFSRVVVGTVTNDEWSGNFRPRVRRFPETESLVNWMGLPGVGAKRVAENLGGYNNSKVPLTINFMSTPQKMGDALLSDLEETVRVMRGVNYVDRFELNISCPNTHGGSGCMDARSEYMKSLSGMLDVVRPLLYDGQELDLKVSPDLNERGVEDIVDLISDYNIGRITIGNTTTNHDPNYINPSPGFGGASGNAVYDASLRTQMLFSRLKKKQEDFPGIIACGGINSVERLKERACFGAEEVQLYTPLIFRGTRLLRDLRCREKT